MANFGDTIEIDAIKTLAQAMYDAGYRGTNALSLLQISVAESDPATLLRLYMTQDGFHPPGQEQVVTATIVGTVTVAGNIVWTITAAALPFGLDHEVEVAVEVGDNAAAVARKSAHILNGDLALKEAFRLIEASGDTVVFHAWCADDDATMNAAYAEGTSDGLTADATSADTTAGDPETVATTGIPILNGESNNLISGSGLPGQFLDAGLIWLYPLDEAGENIATVEAGIIAVGG